MHRSTDRILTTHVGSLIRPDVIRRHLRAKQKDEGYDPAAHARDLKETVAEVVRHQAEVGIDVVSDGEFGKGISWSQYVIERVSGFERRPFNPATGNPFTKGADRELLEAVDRVGGELGQGGLPGGGEAEGAALGHRLAGYRRQDRRQVQLADRD